MNHALLTESISLINYTCISKALNPSNNAKLEILKKFTSTLQRLECPDLHLNQFLSINKAMKLAKLPHQLIASLTQPWCVALPWKTWLVPSHLLAFRKCIWKKPRIWRTYRYFYITSLIIAFPVNKSSVEADFYWTFSLFHGSHIGIPKQWNGGHIGVPDQSCGSWTPIRS